MKYTAGDNVVVHLGNSALCGRHEGDGFEVGSPKVTVNKARNHKEGSREYPTCPAGQKWR